MTNPPSKQTYGERYRTEYQLQAEQCAEHLLGQSLHAPLRWVWPIARKFCQFNFQEERLHLQIIMKLSSQRALHGELVELYFQPRNRTLHRKVFRLRLSTRRARKILQKLPYS